MTATARLRKRLRRAFFGAILAVQSTKTYRHLAARLCPDYRIVEASPEDLVVVHRWWNPAAVAMPSARRPGVTDYVAEANGTILGFGQVISYSGQDAPNEGWWLFSLYVRLRYRGMGIGAALTRKRIEHVVQHGGREVSLLVREGNTAEVELCRRMGFTEAHPPALAALPDKESPPPGQRRIIMTKQL